MADVMDVDALLEQAVAQHEEQQKAKEAAAAKEVTSASSEADTRNPRDRNDRDRRDRDRDRGRDRRDRDRDRDRDRIPRRGDHYRESNNERNRSRDGDRRRDDSRPRSSTKGTNSDDEGPPPIRERDRRSGRDNRDRERDRDRDRERDRRNGGDFYSGGGRARSRSPRRRDEGRYNSNRNARERSPAPRRRDDRRGSARRTITPTSPEPTEDDRDKRTIFVQQISQRAETRHLRAFFEVIGPVVEAQIVKDRVTGRSKGVGYVEFKEEESVPKAIELTGQKLKGVPIIAQHTEAEKNRASRATATESNTNSNNQAPFHRLYVGNIHFSVTEQDLEAVFGPYGELEHVQLQRDDTPQGAGRSRGYGFVQYRDPAAAKAALEQMNGFELANRQIRVGLGNDKFTPESTAQLLRNFSHQASSFQGSAFSGSGGRGAYAGGSGGVFDRSHGRDDRGVTGASALDDNDVGVGGVSRDRLMNMLARNPVDEPKNNRNAPVAVAAPRVPAFEQPMVSRCIKIQNLYNPDEELANFGIGWAKDLETEILAECKKKYGEVVHIAVDPNQDGDVYVKFAALESSEKALQGLNGRNFNFRTIRAAYVVDKVYNSLYAEAAKV
ncbi:hypothetical protein B0J11DRAFT_269644 [Dendryphion nanum]|uniref:RRM domain-containing protein n=1 Tax=Dendryphion nanum TaxID=256645 RepID=A0A9P9E1P6_9PLEO|nr:hypothetical protein B0J11DRAFT_269644 [Dendryphion nanum]